MRFVSLFSGIEAASCAWLPLGWGCAAVAEVEKFPCTVLKHHYPDVPNLGDVTKITHEQIEALGHIDLVAFGFPCQDLSVAGKRAGLHHKDTGEKTRSGLFYDAMRIVRWSRARWAVAENVPGLFSSNDGRDFAAVVGEMVGLGLDVPRDGWRNTGVAAGPDGLCEWAVLDAQWFGIPQRRRRVFLVRDTGNWGSREPVLFERHSLSGCPPPRREKGQGTTRGIEIGPSGGSFTETSPNLDARCKDGFIRNQLGVGAAVIPSTGDISHCMSSGANGHGIAEDAAHALDQAQGQAVAFQPRYYTRDNKTGGRPSESAATLESGKRNGDSQQHVIHHMAVRRLTPRECERLQGFPDDYTKITEKTADGPRYKALGNSMAVPVMRWIGERILAAERGE